ncbi:MAG: hypothetical protein OEW12_07380 [Deltaproteobacteria bacterium]|nr:hypothetical protein [Deltaproteobacteria bacterium]
MNPFSPKNSFADILLRPGSGWGALALAAAFFISPASPALGDQVLMEYSLELATDYVTRGDEMYNSVYEKRQEAEQATNVTPSAMPNITFFGPNGVSFTVGGMFATRDREPDRTGKTGFKGMALADQVDYSLAFGWENKTGGFSIGLLDSTLPHNPDPASGIQEFSFAWTLPFLDVLAPTITHVEDIGSPFSYTLFGVGGGETIVWGLEAGVQAEGTRDITGTLGFNWKNILAVTLNASHRPFPQLHNDWSGTPYAKDGKYTDPTGREAIMPPTIYWISITMTGQIVDDSPAR